MSLNPHVILHLTAYLAAVGVAAAELLRMPLRPPLRLDCGTLGRVLRCDRRHGRRRVSEPEGHPF